MNERLLGKLPACFVVSQEVAFNILSAVCGEQYALEEQHNLQREIDKLLRNTSKRIRISRNG